MYVSLAMLTRLIRFNGLMRVLRRSLVDVRGYVIYGSTKKYANLLIALVQYKLGLVQARAFPHRYYVEPTNACNLRCPYCFGVQGRSDRATGMMSTHLYDLIINQIAPYAFWIDLYSRGEPLLHPNIIHMISYAHSKRIGTKISSNLNIVSVLDVGDLVRSGLDHLVVSLDGATQETYATYRIGGNLEAVLENLRAITAKKKELGSRTPFVTARVLVMKPNEGELDEIRSLAIAAGADSVVYSVMLIDVTNQEDMEKYAPTNPEYSWTRLRSTLSIHRVRSRACPELWHMGTAITWSGTVLPCCYVDDESYSFGSLKLTAFKDIWNGYSYDVSRRAFVKAASTGQHTVCVECLGRIKAR